MRAQPSARFAESSALPARRSSRCFSTLRLLLSKDQTARFRRTGTWNYVGPSQPFPALSSGLALAMEKLMTNVVVVGVLGLTALPA